MAPIPQSLWRPMSGFPGVMPRVQSARLRGSLSALRRQDESVQEVGAVAVIGRRARQGAKDLAPEFDLVHVAAQTVDRLLQPSRNSFSCGLDGGHGVLLMPSHFPVSTKR